MTRGQLYHSKEQGRSRRSFEELFVPNPDSPRPGNFGDAPYCLTQPPSLLCSLPVTVEIKVKHETEDGVEQPEGVVLAGLSWGLSSSTTLVRKPL